MCEHVNGLCPAGWLNEQSITKHWFQSVLVHIVGPLAATIVSIQCNDTKQGECVQKNIPIMSTNFHKTLVWKHEYDVTKRAR